MRTLPAPSFVYAVEELPSIFGAIVLADEDKMAMLFMGKLRIKPSGQQSMMQFCRIN